MKVLVTGSRGYIGYIMVKALLDKGYDVVGLDRNYFPKECFGRNDAFEAYNKIPLITKDIRDVSKDDLSGIDAVIHLAGLIDDPEGKIWGKLQMDINYLSTLQLAINAERAGVKRFVLASTTSIYGTSGNTMVNEESKFQPVTIYALSKWYSEQALLNMEYGDMAITCMRNGTCFGISPRMRINMVLNALTAFAYVDKKIKVSGDGLNYRPIVHIEDVAESYIQILEADPTKVKKQIFNVGCGTYTINEMASEVKKILPDSEILHVPEGADKRSYNVSFEKIHDILNFKAKYSMQDGIRELVAGYEEFGLSKENILSDRFWSVKFYKSLLESGNIK